MATNDQVQKYYDALIESYDILTDAIARANERGLKISKQFATDVAKGQREALELGRKLGAEPTDLGQFYTAVLEATTSAQGRALAFTQAAYQEAMGASTDTREIIQKLVEVNREASQAAVSAMQTWTTANPFAETFKRTMEAFTPATNGKVKKDKAEKAAV
jgi:hypothetical protein